MFSSAHCCISVNVILEFCLTFPISVSYFSILNLFVKDKELFSFFRRVIFFNDEASSEFEGNHLRVVSA